MNYECPIHRNPQAECPHCNPVNLERRRDVAWVVLLIIGIALAPTVRFPLSVIQAVMCGFLLVLKLAKLFRA